MIEDHDENFHFDLFDHIDDIDAFIDEWYDIAMKARIDPDVVYADDLIKRWHLENQKDGNG